MIDLQTCLQLSSESMNATLLAMTNSAAESFIIMNSIFFGVSDIGISTVVQQAAFYSFIVQSKSFGTLNGRVNRTVCVS